MCESIPRNTGWEQIENCMYTKERDEDEWVNWRIHNLKSRENCICASDIPVLFGVGYVSVNQLCKDYFSVREMSTYAEMAFEYGRTNEDRAIKCVNFRLDESAVPNKVTILYKTPHGKHVICTPDATGKDCVYEIKSHFNQRNIYPDTKSFFESFKKISFWFYDGFYSMFCVCFGDGV